MLTPRVVKLLTLLVMSFPLSILAQSPPHTLSDREYFQYVFMSWNNPEVSQARSQQFKSHFVLQFGLTPTEAALMDDLSREYRASMLGIRSQAFTIHASKAAASAESQNQVAALDLSLSTTTQALIQRFYSVIRPQVLAKIREAIDTIGRINAKSK